MSSRSWSAVRASVAATPGPSSSSSSGSTVCRTRTRVNAGSRVVRVLPELDALDLAGGDRVGAGDVEQRPAVAVEAAAHPGERPAARAAGQAEQHGLGLVVAGVPEQHGGRAEALGRPARARRSGPGGRPPPAPGRPPRRAPAPLSGLVGAERGHLRDDPRRVLGRARPGARGRRSRRRPASRPCGPRRRSPPAARASRRRRSRRPRTVCAGLEVGERAAYGEADRGDGRVEAHAPQRTREIQALRVGDLGLGRQVLGALPDGVELVHAGLVDDARGRTSRRRGTAPSWRPGRAAGAAAGRGRRRPCGAG